MDYKHVDAIITDVSNVNCGAGAIVGLLDMVINYSEELTPETVNNLYGIRKIAEAVINETLNIEIQLGIIKGAIAND